MRALDNFFTLTALESQMKSAESRERLTPTPFLPLSKPLRSSNTTWRSPDQELRLRCRLANFFLSLANKIGIRVFKKSASEVILDNSADIP